MVWRPSRARTLGSGREAVNRGPFRYRLRVERLALFARTPVPGQVKTRLTPALPARLACDLYRGLLGDALDTLRAARAGERWLYLADDAAAERKPGEAGAMGSDLDGIDLPAGVRTA